MIHHNESRVGTTPAPDTDPAAVPPNDSMPALLPKLEHASLSDPGKRRLANEDASHSDPNMGLFVVCDGIGGQPSGEAASQIIAHSLGHRIRRRLRGLDAIDEDTLCRIMTASTAEVSHHLREHSQRIDALRNMGATLVAALFDSNSVYVLHAGDSRAYLLRDGELRRLTEDHTRQFRQIREPDPDILVMEEDQDLGKERRLLMQFIGMSRPLSPDCRRMSVEPSDRILLCSDGLTDPVDDAVVKEILLKHASTDDACRALVDAANAAGGPDNITVAVVDYHGARQLGTEQLRALGRGKRRPTKQGVAARFHAGLSQVERLMIWLREGAGESDTTPAISAFAAVKRRLGAEVYAKFLDMHPSQNASHVFHRAATDPDSVWRKQYEALMAELDPIVADMTEGSVRLSPVLAADETALIIKTLWGDWRWVERRYFATCQREAISESEQTLNILIDHMYKSVRTLIGLMEFFPRFLRDPG